MSTGGWSPEDLLPYKIHILADFAIGTLNGQLGKTFKLKISV